MIGLKWIIWIMITMNAGIGNVDGWFFDQTNAAESNAHDPHAPMAMHLLRSINKSDLRQVQMNSRHVREVNPDRGEGRVHPKPPSPDDGKKPNVPPKPSGDNSKDSASGEGNHKSTHSPHTSSSKLSTSKSTSAVSSTSASTSRPTSAPTSPRTSLSTSHGTTPKPACPWGNWGPWSKCDCRLAVQTRQRSLMVIPSGQCDIIDCGQHMIPCARDHCPIDCVYSRWSSWNTCIGGCGQGVRKRTRGIIVPALYGGKPCTKFSQRQPCRVIDAGCSDECDQGEWGAWSQCLPPNPHSPCDCSNHRPYQATGHQIRERIIIDRSHQCPEAKETKECRVTCCP